MSAENLAEEDLGPFYTATAHVAQLFHITCQGHGTVS